jgi:hypothetical protein
MSAETQTAKGQTDETRCWCCGQTRSEDTLVHLGNLWALTEFPRTAIK